MLSRKKWVVSVSFILAILSFSAQAQIIQFTSSLSGDWNENFVFFPETGTGSSSTGILNFDYDTDFNQISNLNLSVQGLSLSDMGATAAGHSHIHPSGDPSWLVNVGIMGFVDVPGGMEITNGSAVIGDVEEAALLSGTSWINIHTNAFPSGEIAGVVTPVPLPPALWLFIAGLSCLAGAIKKNMKNRVR